MQEPMPSGSGQPTCGAEVGAEGAALPSPVGVTAKFTSKLRLREVNRVTDSNFSGTVPFYN